MVHALCLAFIEECRLNAKLYGLAYSRAFIFHSDTAHALMNDLGIYEVMARMCFSMIVYTNTYLNGHIEGLRKLSAFCWVRSFVYRFDESVCIYFDQAYFHWFSMGHVWVKLSVKMQRPIQASRCVQRELYRK